MRRFQAEVVAGTARDYIAAKLGERDACHQRMGDSRYVIEPNVKDGKGRPARPAYAVLDRQICVRVEQPADLVDRGLFSAAEFRRFERAERFFWLVRCYLHPTGRAEERLGFELQRQIAGDAIRRPAGQIRRQRFYNS
jgi:[protein-PII] uridylyltransferase